MGCAKVLEGDVVKTLAITMKNGTVDAVFEGPVKRLRRQPAASS